MNVRTKFEVRSFAHSWDNNILGYSKNLGNPWIRLRSLFSQIFQGLFRMDAVNVWAKRAVGSFICSWDNSDCSFGLEPQSWVRRGHTGSGMVPFERALVSSYRLTIVTFPLSLHVSEILLLLCFSTPLFPTPPRASPKFPHVPLGVGGWALGDEERIVRAISFQDFQPMWSWSTNVTDGRRDGRMTCNLNTALCTKFHRAVIIQ